MEGLQNLITNLTTLVNSLLPVTVSIALLAFFWGLAKFIFKASSEGAQEEGRRLMIWGVIALFVMVSIWGIVNFIGGDLGIGSGGEIGVVQIQQ